MPENALTAGPILIPARSAIAQTIRKAVSIAARNRKLNKLKSPAFVTLSFESGYEDIAKATIAAIIEANTLNIDSDKPARKLEIILAEGEQKYNHIWLNLV